MQSYPERLISRYLLLRQTIRKRAEGVAHRQVRVFGNWNRESPQIFCALHRQASRRSETGTKSVENFFPNPPLHSSWNLVWTLATGCRKISAMSLNTLRIIVVSFVVLFSSVPVRAQSASTVAFSAASPRPAYLDPSLPIDQRVNDLVSRMTLEEKASQMQDVAAAIPRLNVPAYNWWNEGLHGVARAGIATVFPQAIGIAATCDTDLVHRVAEVISTEARAKYNDAIQHGNTGRYYLNPASSSLFSCKFARKSRFSPRIFAAVDDFVEK